MTLIARWMQLAGLFILPIGVLMELSDQVGLRESLVIAAFGAILFVLGYVLQGMGQKS